MNNKLAILVVYFLDDADIDILNLHLQRVKQHTKTDYKILCTANRISQNLKTRLQQEENLEIINTETTELRLSQEHSYYLSKLSDYATKNHYSHICTLDCDSFPISDCWDTQLITNLTTEMPVTAILRKENGDTFLPHPSMCLFSTEFYKKYPFDFFPNESIINNTEFKSFLSDTKQKNPDSGIGLGFILYKNNLKFNSLLRSNVNEEHYLLAGIYDHKIFHLGSMSWGKRDFRLDRKNSFRIKLAVYIRNNIMHCPEGSYRKKINDLIEAPALENIRQKNADTYHRIRTKLRDSPSDFFNYLSNTKI